MLWPDSCSCTKSVRVYLPDRATNNMVSGSQMSKPFQKGEVFYEPDHGRSPNSWFTLRPPYSSRPNLSIPTELVDGGADLPLRNYSWVALRVPVGLAPMFLLVDFMHSCQRHVFPIIEELDRSVESTRKRTWAIGYPGRFSGAKEEARGLSWLRDNIVTRLSIFRSL